MSNQSQIKGHRNLRQGRCSQEGGIYLITSTTWRRVQVFAEWRYAYAAIQAFTGDEVLKDAQLLAWVLMPDHVHWLVQLGQDRDLRSLIGIMKSASARAVGDAGYTPQVWSRAYYDRAIRSEDCIASAARYIVANPLRAGLVQSVGNYPFWHAIYL